MKCTICGQATEGGYFSKTWNDSHYKTHHSEYAQWLGRWIKTFIIVGTLDVLVLGFFLYLLYDSWTSNVAPLLTALILYLVSLWILLMRYFQRTSFFKHQWREHHSNLSQGAA